MFSFDMLIVHAEHQRAGYSTSSSRATLWGMNIVNIKQTRKVSVVRIDLDLHHHALARMSQFLISNKRMLSVKKATPLSFKGEPSFTLVLPGRSEWVTPGEAKFSVAYSDLSFGLPVPEVDRLHVLTVAEMR